ncbi:MAG TPA: protein kinase [Acidimicrobiales bacterium]|jgi:serine/threonine-protein kinase|nr:protein kinase [Acidimicrobiales bacterium]
MPSITDSIGRVLGDRYRLVTALGTGASAHVYLAEDVSLHRRVAIKVLHPALAGDVAFLKRFRAEARAVAALNHPNILQVYDWGEEGGEPYLVLEYLAGGSLRQFYDSGALLTPEQAVRIGLEAAAGLDYAHRRGLVHRDIKPANLLFDADHRLRIADFGLARALAEAAWTEPEGAILGTARYAAPEQVEGWTLDGRADVYALALVLYEGVTGKAPFVGDTTIATLMARVGTLLPEHEALGPLNEVLVWAAAPEPDERYDAAALILRLQAVAIALPEPEPLVLPGSTAVKDLSRTEPALPGGDERTIVDRRDATEIGVGTALLSPEKPADKPSRVSDPPAPGTGAPRSRKRWPWIAGIAVVVAVLIAAGLVLAFRSQLFTTTHPVPSLVGKTVPAAVKATAADHFKVHQSSSEFSTTVGPGVILSQQPAAKGGHNPAMAKEGTTIDVVVSKGLPPVTIPSNLTSYTSCADAIQALAAVHLVGVCPDSAAQYNPTVGAGGILGTSPANSATYGSTVTIITSKGHAPVAIPPVTGSGSTYASAAAALSAAGFNPVQANAYSSTVPAGQVIGTSPDPSAGPAPYQSTVTVNVSLGPQPVPVPNLSGDTVAQATSALQAKGLTVGAVYGPAKGKVFLTTPDEGTNVSPGTAVNMYTA